MESISKFILIATALLLGFASSASADDAKKAPEPAQEKLQIKGHRFSRHAGQDFERLVIEFSGGNASKPMPVKLVSNPVEKSATLTIDGLSLVGAIPEASINDSFVKKSKYLGPVSINPEAAGTVLKTSYKDATVSVDAFWLHNPSRLVIDAFPPASPRAVGPAVVKEAAPQKPAETKKEQTTTKAQPSETKVKVLEPKKAEAPAEKPRAVAASEKPAAMPTTNAKPADVKAPATPVTNEKAPAAPKAAATTALRTHKFVCYSAKSQVATSVSYEDTKGKRPGQLFHVETTGEEVAVPTVTSPDEVVCFPKAAELKAVVHFAKVLINTSAVENAPAAGEKLETSAANDAPVSPKPVTVPTPLKRHPTSMPPSLPAANGLGKIPPMPSPEGEKQDTTEKLAEKDKKTVEE